MKEVKPCPFCGEDPIVYHSDINDKWVVACDNNKCSVRPCTGLYYHKRITVNKWNTRMKPVTLEVSDEMP